MAEDWTEPNHKIRAQYRVTFDARGRATVSYASPVGKWRTCTFEAGPEAGAFTARLADGQFPVVEALEDTKSAVAVVTAVGFLVQREES